MSIFSKFIRGAGSLGLYRFASLLTKSQPRILVYHRFSVKPKHGYCTAKNFEAQLQYIARNYNVVSMTDLATNYYDKKKMTKNTIALTVDDGYDDFYKIAYPLLKKYKLPATLYVTTGFIEGHLWLWPDKISYILKNAPLQRPSFKYKNVVDLPAVNDESKKTGDWQYLIDQLLSVSDDIKHDIIFQLAKAWEVDLPDHAPDEYKSSTEQHLLEMSENNIEIGGHTVTHPSLGKVSMEQASIEITESKKYLDNLLGGKLRSFCYPNGTENDYTPEIKELTKNAGYSCAVTAFSDNQGTNHRYAIRRHGAGDDMFQFCKAVSGVEYLGHCLRHFCRKQE